MSKERVIRKITVQSGGLKGLILEGTKESVKENKVVTNTFKDGIKHPVNADLEDKIKEFRFFALDICGLITDDTKKGEKITLLEGCDVSSIEFEKGPTGYFKIKVSSRIFDTKTITLTTPKTDSSDGYEYFDTVMNVVDSLLVEVEQYEKGLKKISDEDLMISYIRHGKDKSMDMDKLNEMTAEEKADYCQSILEKLGCLVIRPDEVYEEEEVEEVSLETNTGPLLLEMSTLETNDNEDFEEIPAPDFEKFPKETKEENVRPDKVLEPVLLKAKK